MPEPVRVLHIVTRMNVGGASRHLLSLLPLLREHGFDPILAHGTTRPEEGELPVEGVRAVRVPALRRSLAPVTDARAYADLSNLIRRTRPSVVHTHMAKAGALGRMAARRRRVPGIVHTFHGHVLEGYFSGATSRAFVEAERRLARHTDALVAVSGAVRDDLLRLGIGDPARWRVVPPGFDLGPLLRSQVDREAARTSLGLPPEGSAVGIVGRLVPIKGHEVFLEAARRVAERRADVTFVVVGDGELRATLEDRARRALGARVRFTGWVAALPELYAALDVVALSSLNEGTPVVLIEAAAAGLPVVATDVGGVRDVVVDGGTGYLVASGDAVALAERIDDLLGDRERARAIGAEARRRVRAAFSPTTTADAIAAVYAEILAARSRTLR